MNFAEQILKEILNEEVNIPYVSDAIKKKYEVELNYRADEDEKGTGKRIIQPVALGHSRSGNLVLRAFQPYGDTKTKIPKWKLFRLDKIEEWKPMKKRRFRRPPGKQFNAEGEYNPNGDGAMTDVLIQADFTGQEAYAQGTGKYAGLKHANDERAEQKRSKNPYIDLQKNIKKSFDGNKIDYIKKNIEDWQKSKGSEFFKKDKGNKQSAYEMSQIEDFGNDDTTQTVGPITKNNVDIKSKSTKPLNYQQPKNNGPVMKNNNNEEENENTNEKV
jgi:hypothetical protein